MAAIAIYSIFALATYVHISYFDNNFATVQHNEAIYDCHEQRKYIDLAKTIAAIVLSVLCPLYIGAKLAGFIGSVR